MQVHNKEEKRGPRLSRDKLKGCSPVNTGQGQGGDEEISENLLFGL